MENGIYLNSDNQKIVDYFSQRNLDNYKKAFLDLLDQGIKIDKKEIKKILKFVRANDLQNIKLHFDIIFGREDIFLAAKSPTKKSDYGGSQKSSYSRLKKYRTRAKQKGLKNLSFLISPDDYKKIRDLKRSKSMTYSEILSYLLAKV